MDGNISDRRTGEKSERVCEQRASAPQEAPESSGASEETVHPTANAGTYDVDWSEIGAITFDCKYNRIRIYKSLLRAMGNPPFIVILINEEDRQIALLGKDEEVEDSFRVPVELMSSPDKSFVLHGRWFILKMMRLMGWKKHSYRVRCETMLDKVVPVFDLDEAVRISDESDEQ